MISKFKIGDTQTFVRKVEQAHIAQFESGKVHDFYGTFALGQDAEWASRLFVLEMLEDDEEGIGTYLTVKHKSPALVGQRVEITATIEELFENKINCSYVAKVGARVVANGTTGQMILKKSEIEKIRERAK